MAEKGKGKKGKAAGYTSTGKTNADGLAIFSGKTKITQDSPDLVFEFAVPAESAFTIKGLKPEQLKEFYGHMLSGAYAASARKVRVENDTRLKYRGAMVNAFTLTPVLLSKILNKMYEYSLDSGKAVPKRIANIAALATERGVLVRNESVEKSEDGKAEYKVVTFTPATK